VQACSQNQSRLTVAMFTLCQQQEIGISVPHRLLLGAIFCMAVIAPPAAYGYSPGLHKKALVEGAAICLSTYGVRVSQRDLEGMIRGVREPDDPSLSTLQMFKQRVEPGSYGRQRKISTIRIAAQSLHASPNPTRRIYGKSKTDREALKRTIRIPKRLLMRNRLDVEIFSYDTNQGVRNKMLLNASQYLCVSLAHKSPAQSAMKFGNFMHMIGDSFSASHVQRSAPVGSPGRCGTDKIEWLYSMDLISWKQHRPADLNSSDWRFRCLKLHTATLIRQWVMSRAAVRKAGQAGAKKDRANMEVKKFLRLLCRNILRADQSALKKPAGGANAGYSSASGTDNWRVFNKKRPDLAIQPVGLTSAEEARAFYADVTRRLKKEGTAAEFSYPSRAYPDFCAAILAGGPLKAPLQCTDREIGWAMSDSRRVRSMWIPARKLRY